jgi:MtaA/CmuA family methyltransferase
MNSKERCLAAVRGAPLDRVPVFPLIMFLAANRFQVPYRAYASDGQVLAEAQLALRERFGVDAITSCSDAFRLSADLGGEMLYPEDGTPYLSRPLLTCQADLKRLHRPDVLQSGSRTADRIRATGMMARAAGQDCLVLGWVDLPFAEACSLCGVSQFLMLLVDQPGLAQRILEFLTDIVIDFALAQLQAGAPMIGAGDAAASLVSARMYRQFALPYEQRICAAVHAAGGLVKLHICGNTTHLLKEMVQSGADLFNVDHLVDLQTALAVYQPAGKCIKGNLDPVRDLLQASLQTCQRSAVRCIEQARSARYMLSAGCEIPAGVSDEVFRAFCRAPYQRASYQRAPDQRAPGQILEH